jgi:pimeloyl-ACP methyl ester carboxylesterase
MVFRVFRVLVVLSLITSIGCAGHDVPWGEDDPRYFKGDFVTVDGKKTFYIDRGDGPVVVLLHGLPLSSWEWRQFIPVLAENYRVITPDLYGFGYSDRPRDADYSWPAYGEWLNGFLEAMGIDRATFVVTDIAGPISFELLAAHPEKVSGLVIANTWYTDQAFHMPFLLKLLTWSPTGWMGIYATNRPMVGIQTRAMFADKEKSKGEFEDQVWMSIKTIQSRKILQKVLRGFRSDHKDMFRKSLQAFEGPVLLAWGEQDPAIPPENVGLFKLLLPQSEIERFPDAGHFLAQEKPQEFSARILEFLDHNREKL